MKLRFSWLNSRKSLIIGSFIDFLLFSYFFSSIFISSISSKPTLLNLTLLNSLIWIICSYIIGRYSNFRRAKFSIFLFQFLKTFLIICLSLLINQVLFRLFWNWNYMNFESFSNFLNDFLTFYKNVFLFSGLTQVIINFYLAKKYTSKALWLFLGKEERLNYVRKLIGNKTEFKIQNFEPENLNDKKLNARGIIIDDEQVLEKKNVQDLFKLKKKGIKFIKASNWCEFYLNRIPSDLIKISEIIEGKFYYNEFSFKARVKRIVESIFSLIILFFSLPIILLAGLLIKLEDGGPIFYSQVRNGFEGKEFKIIKLRTMVTDAEKDGEQWAKKSDTRITNVGHFLRKLRIDELPQLILVLSGEMSLIGPRPERPKIDLLLRESITNYDLRYSIKPGISGWAQVNYPYGASIEDSKIKLSYDVYYIKNFSILLDFMIFFKTLKLIINGKGSVPLKQQNT